MPASHTMPAGEMQEPLTLDDGVVYFGRDAAGHRVFREAYPCYQCGEPITGALVYQVGHPQPGVTNTAIVLHPACAEELAGNLITDAANARRAE